MEELIQVIPTVPLRGRVLFTAEITKLEVGREKSVAAIRRAMENDRRVFVVAQRDDETENPVESDLYRVGVIATLSSHITDSGNGTVQVIVTAEKRATLSRFFTDGEYFASEVTDLPITEDDPVKSEAALRVAKSSLQEFAETGGISPKARINTVVLCDDPASFPEKVTEMLYLKKEEKQALLEEGEVAARLTLLSRYIEERMQIARIQRQIAQDVKKSIDENQKEYYLREQIKAIHKELGDDEEENEQIIKKIKEKKMPEKIREKVLKEMSRMDKMSAGSPEGTVIRNYVDWVLDLPFSEKTEDDHDILHAERVLNEDHFGLEKVKERVIEYLAVHTLTNSLKGPILCFVGPPGVGKTSVARSIARALGRKFVRMSLGGLKDEAEIRGHRRTYIGAMPGRIIYELRAAKTNNPVFLLDEIDKISSDMRGDPASALLEVLDPEQNSTYRDRYLEEEFDLSDVMFITTANTLETIPAPLRDRMEIIEISGYTTEEKIEIAKRYLLPKKLKEHGLSENAVTVTDGAFRKMAEQYTMEAGVRNLERTVADVCRKYAVKKVKDPKTKPARVTETSLENYLGKPKYTLNDTLQEDSVGLCNGLAWTAVGGVTLEVEVNLMQGKGELNLTGSLGDVMKESALTALSYIRSSAEAFGIDPARFEKTDVHLHVPEGATPKDGPSAGITIATALYSAFTGKKVKKSVAMTGEITLRGRVLPIGGLKEKSLAAIRRGVKTIVVPKENEKDMEEIPSYLVKDAEFVFVGTAEEVFALATY